MQEMVVAVWYEGECNHYSQSLLFALSLLVVLESIFIVLHGHTEGKTP